jgi:hypothetical protein
MQDVMAVATVIAGMILSLAVALLVEELIFGKVFGIVLAPRGRTLVSQRRGEAAVSNK